MIKYSFYVVVLRETRLLPPLTYPAIILKRSIWDDHGFRTSFVVELWLERGVNPIELGTTKILRLGMGDHGGETQLPEPPFHELPSDYCSLGAETKYYERIAELTQEQKYEFLHAIRDFAYLQEIRGSFQLEPGFKRSLLRFNAAEAALAAAPFLLGVTRTTTIDQAMSFVFITKLPDASAPHRISFELPQGDSLPYRFSVLIGRNGSGKTQILSRLAHVLSGFGTELAENIGRIEPARPAFRRVIAISYSAFDQFEIPGFEAGHDGVDQTRAFGYKYVGLRRPGTLLDVQAGGFPRFVEMLKNIKLLQRAETLNACLTSALGEQLARSLIVSEGPLARRAYDSLSAGQRIVVSFLSEVLEFIDESSVLLFDEPETHLHPGLLSTLLSVLHVLLDEFRSHCIIATHSPIILQEVPSRYVQVLRRYGNVPLIDHPIGETFGESLSILIDQVLGPAERERDFRQVLKRLAGNHFLEQVEEMFEGKLSLNARLFLQSCYRRPSES